MSPLPPIEIEPMPNMTGRSRSYGIGVDWHGDLEHTRAFRNDPAAYRWMHDRAVAIKGVAQAYPDPAALRIGINLEAGASWDDVHPEILKLMRAILERIGVTDEVAVVEVPFRGFAP